MAEKEKIIITDDIIGVVFNANVVNNTIDILVFNPNDERIKKNENFVVRSNFKNGDYKLYFCIVKNMWQDNSENINTLAKLNKFELSEVEYAFWKNAGFNDDKGLRMMASLDCLITLYYSNGEVKRENFMRPPLALDHVKVPTDKEYEDAVAYPEWKNYWIGHLVNKEEITVPINFQKLIEINSGIFGMTGSGKSVSTRNICKTIIHDPDEKLKATLIIMDIMNEYALNTHSRVAAEKGLLEYNELKSKIEVFILDKKHAINSKLCSESNNILTSNNGYKVKQYYIYKRNITSDLVVSFLSREPNFSDKMRVTIHEMENEVWRRRKNNQIFSFYQIMEEFYNDGFSEETLGYTLTGKNESSYYALRWRIGELINMLERRYKLIRDDVDGDMDTIEYILSYLDNLNPNFNDSQTQMKVPKSFIISFGSCGTNDSIKDFVANILAYYLYKTYTGENYFISDDYDADLRYKRCVMLLEEAHNYLGLECKNPIFTKIAKETRKFNLTLMIVDQAPSVMDPYIMSQLQNRIIHQLKDSNDIRNGLSGMGDYGSYVQKLNTGEAFYIGNMTKIPTIVKTYYPKNIEDELNKRFGLQNHQLKLPKESKSFNKKSQTLIPIKTVNLLDDYFEENDEI